MDVSIRPVYDMASKIFPERRGIPGPRGSYSYMYTSVFALRFVK